MIKHRPFLKWAGNKYQILEYIMAMLPSGRRLIEPFVGSGAVFLNSDYESYLLADSNKYLINLFQTLQREGESFIDYCRSFFTAETNRDGRYYDCGKSSIPQKTPGLRLPCLSISTVMPTMASAAITPRAASTRLLDGTPNRAFPSRRCVGS